MTAYEMLRSLVGSEMCIRDSHSVDRAFGDGAMAALGVDPDRRSRSAELPNRGRRRSHWTERGHVPEPVSYTHLQLPTIYSV